MNSLSNQELNNLSDESLKALLALARSHWLQNVEANRNEDEARQASELENRVNQVLNNRAWN